MSRFTYEIRQLGALSFVFAAAAACGGNTGRASAPTELTSAPPEGRPVVTLENVTRLERERDEAREQLQRETARHQAERLHLQADILARKERDDVATSVWMMIDSADAQLRLLKGKAARAPAAERRKMEKRIAEAQNTLFLLERDARRVPAEHSASWPNLRRALEAAANDLAKALQRIAE